MGVVWGWASSTENVYIVILKIKKIYYYIKYIYVNYYGHLCYMYMHVVILMYTVSVSGVFYCWLIWLIVMNLIIHVAPKIVIIILWDY